MLNPSFKELQAETKPSDSLQRATHLGWAVLRPRNPKHKMLQSMKPFDLWPNMSEKLHSTDLHLMNTIIESTCTYTNTCVCMCLCVWMHTHAHPHIYEPLDSKLCRELSSAGFWLPGKKYNNVGPSAAHQSPGIGHRQDTLGHHDLPVWENQYALLVDLRNQ